MRQKRNALRLDLMDEEFEWHYRDFLGRGWRFYACLCPDRRQNREGNSLPSIHTAAFGRVHIMRVAVLALCYGGSSNLA
jgi:hypothetical protein